MSERPLWFDGSIIGAIVALVISPAAADVGLLIVSLLALGCFVAPVVAWIRGDRSA